MLTPSSTSGVTGAKPSGRVLVLGAGFSRAVSRAMPLTDELGRMVLDDLRAGGAPVPAIRFSGGYFEAWLSRLAEPQPDLQDWENFENQALFLRLTEQVRTVLLREQGTVLSGMAPPWLLRLIAVLHRTRTTVITFNYDLLVEAALNTAPLAGPDGSGRPTSGDATQDLPPGPGPEGPAGGVATFPLLKLHGSVDCWWVGGDPTGTTIVRQRGLPAFGREDGTPDSDRRPPGRSAFIVPPASGKSRFYANPVTRELWQQAGRALGHAAAVDLVGCSLPPSDLATSGMLAHRLARPDVAVRVINPYPDAPVAALDVAGVTATAFAGGAAELADDMEARLAAAAWDELAALGDGDDAGGLPVLAGPAPYWSRVAVGVRSDGALLVEPGTDGASATRPRREDDPTPTTVREVRGLRGDGGPLYVQAGATRSAVIGWQTRSAVTGHNDLWAWAVTASPTAPASP